MLTITKGFLTKSSFNYYVIGKPSICRSRGHSSNKHLIIKETLASSKRISIWTNSSWLQGIGRKCTLCWVTICLLISTRNISFSTRQKMTPLSKYLEQISSATWARNLADKPSTSKHPLTTYLVAAQTALLQLPRSIKMMPRVTNTIWKMIQICIS
jgi:hypothetical protein